MKISRCENLLQPFSDSPFHVSWRLPWCVDSHVDRVLYRIRDVSSDLIIGKLEKHGAPNVVAQVYVHEARGLKADQMQNKSLSTMPSKMARSITEERVIGTIQMLGSIVCFPPCFLICA